MSPACRQMLQLQLEPGASWEWKLVAKDSSPAVHSLTHVTSIKTGTPELPRLQSHCGNLVKRVHDKRSCNLAALYSMSLIIVTQSQSSVVWMTLFTLWAHPCCKGLSHRHLRKIDVAARIHLSRSLSITWTQTQCPESLAFTVFRSMVLNLKST